MGSEPEVTNIRPSNHATEGGKMMFDRGNAVLSDNTKSELDAVAAVIRGHRNIVMVKGHTSLDDFADGATGRAEDGSVDSARASGGGLPRRRRAWIRAHCACRGARHSSRSRSAEYTPDAQALNRRVEVEATNTLMDDLEDQAGDTYRGWS